MTRALLAWCYAWFALLLVCLYAVGISEPFRFERFAIYLASATAYACCVAGIYWEE